MSNHSFLLILILICGVLRNVNSDRFGCHEDSDNFKCQLNSITPYRYIANFNDSEIKFPGCEAKKIWLIIRHGTRYPGKKIFKHRETLEEIKRVIVEKCKSSNCPLTNEQLEVFKIWEQKLNRENILFLTEEGENELIGLGERFQSRFPGLMPEKFDNKTFKFKFTQTQRTEESARNFAIGLFGEKGSRDVWYPETDEKDPILRFYKACKRWIKEVYKNPEAQEEEESFKNTNLVKDMLERISNRFGVNVSFVDVKTVRDMCAFETAWSENNVSPWCALLLPEEFKIIEYADDLHHYWHDGYKIPLTYEQACNAAGDMFKFFDSDNETKTTAYFTHSGALLKMISLFGIAKDEIPLKHDEFSTSHQRLWRTSRIDAFATNLAFIYFDCEADGKRVLVMHQERIINLPGCPNDYPCSLSTLKDNYPDREDECEFQKKCHIELEN